MKPILLVFLALFCVLFSAKSFSWELEADTDGIKIYTEEIAQSSFKAFRGEMYLQSTLKEITAQLMDVESMKDWLHDCSKSELVSKLEGREFIIYQQTSAPWPVSDRDYLLHSKVVQDPQSKVVSMTFTALVDDSQRDEDCVRVTELKGSWRLTPNGNGDVFVEYETHADPAGQVPAWLANRFVVDQPLNTLRNLAKRIGSPSSTTEADLNFILEP